MSVLRGTQLASQIVPGTTEDIYPTHEATYGKGGLRAVETYADLALIKRPRLEVGMFVYVIEQGKLYVCEEIGETASEDSWVEWESGGGGSDLNSYTESFTATADTSLTITHNLGRYPSITVRENSTGDVIVGEYEYTDENNIELTFSEAVSGTVYLI
jgi:hypothetical protein